MRQRLADELKAALRAGDKPRLSTLRMVQAAVQERDIANRGAGKGPAGDDELPQLLAKLVKQREESARAFEAGGRPELAAQEQAEIAVIRGFLPAQMDEAALRKAVGAAVVEAGAQGPKDMGRVMALLKERHAGQMDFGLASRILKELLQGRG